MIRRPPRSTPLSLHDALPIYSSSSGTRRNARSPFAWPRALACAHPCDAACKSRLATHRKPSNLTAAPSTYDSPRSEEHTSELQSRLHLVCRLLLEKTKENESASSLLAQSSHTTSAIRNAIVLSPIADHALPSSGAVAAIAAIPPAAVHSSSPPAVI